MYTLVVKAMIDICSSQFRLTERVTKLSKTHTSTDYPIENSVSPLNVGYRIRILREQRGLSLRELAERCGLSLNAISKIERGENSPTVASLHLLASALKVPITEFFREASDQRIVHVRRTRRLETSHDGIAIASLGMGLYQQQLEPFLMTLQAEAGTDGVPVTHEGQEFVYCVEGEVQYEISGELFALEQGDSLLFESIQPHRCLNLSSKSAVILVVFQSHEGTEIARQRHLDT